jgi:SAM-dependent methyltransferase
MPFQAGRFSAVVSFTMLHHVPSPESQDRLLAEVCRVLRPGGVFAGSDSTASFLFRLAHLGDTMVLIDPDRFASRLQAAGFADAGVRRGNRAFSFRAIRPPTSSGT